MHFANLCCHCKNFIQNAYCKFTLSLQESYPKCVLQICAVIARSLSKKCILQSYAVIARILSKMHISKLCCHCKNFIQNAYCKIMLSLQEFYAKRVLQIYAVIARILSTPYTAIILWGFSSK